MTTTTPTETSASTTVPPTGNAPAVGPGDAPAAPQADTSGFYRLQDQALQFAPNVVPAPGSSEAAHAHHNLPLLKPEPQGRHRRPDPRP